MIGDLLEVEENALFIFLLEGAKAEAKLFSAVRLFFEDVVIPLLDSWGHMAVQSELLDCLNWSSLNWAPDILVTGDGVLIVLSEAFPSVEGIIGWEGTGEEPKMAAPVDALVEFVGP